MRLKTAPSFTSRDEPLAGPEREVVLEPLAGDPTHLYLEVVSRWAQLLAPRDTERAVGCRNVRPIDRPPSEYVGETYAFIGEKLVPRVRERVTSDVAAEC